VSVPSSSPGPISSYQRRGIVRMRPQPLRKLPRSDGYHRHA
jgi:hypothetical protein